MVAMSMFALLLVGVAKLNFDLARGVYPVSAGAARSGVTAQAINQFFAMSYDSIAAYNGRTDSVSATPQGMAGAAISYTRQVSVTTVSGTQLNVTIIITPSNSAFKPDTVTFERTKPPANPLST
jgi:hypothetical protein